jgi:D-amino-acid oxidase
VGVVAPPFPQQESHVDVLVLGAGVSGLTTAVALAESGEHQVRVVTKDDPLHTTSVAAGAVWALYSVAGDTRVHDWAEQTLRVFDELHDQRLTESIRRIPGRLVSRQPEISPPPEAALLSDLRRCETSELPSGYKSGFHYTAPVVAMPSYLKYLVARLDAAGGKLELQEVDSLRHALEYSDTVVNCTGFAAAESNLGADEEMEPARGRVVVVKNPGIREFLLDDSTGSESTYLIPHGNQVVLGGTLERGCRSVEDDPRATRGILDRCAAVDPRLKDAPVLAVRVGIRPNRRNVRLEQDPELPRLIHNYGHGGSGVSLSWGCAFAVRDLLG